MIALWILLAVFALIVLLLVLPVQIYLHYTPESGLQYRLKYGPILLADSQKPKKEKKAKSTPQKKPEVKKESKKKSDHGAVSFLLSFLGLEDVSTAAKAKQSISDNGLLETIGNVLAAVKNLFSRIFKLIGKGVFSRFDLQIVVGDDDAADAAMTYGTVCTAVYPLLTLLDSAMKFRNRNVDIRCDFMQEQITARFDGQLYYHPYSFVGFAFGLIWRYLKQVLSKEGSKS